MLREISLLPCARKGAGLTKGLPLQFRIRHLPNESAGVRNDSRVPSPEAVQDLLSRCPGLRWEGVGPVARWQRLLARGTRLAIEPIHPRLFDPGLHWLNEDAIPSPARGKRIVVQTHLDGLPSKRWPVDRWQPLLLELATRFPTDSIEVLDPSGAIFRRTGIVVHDALTFPQAVRLVESAHLLVSVDSWSKYVAGWKRIPQVIIVPDQTPDYPQLTASAVWRHSFRGLHRCPEIKLVGLKPDGLHCARYTFGSMAALTPGGVFGEIEQRPPERDSKSIR